MVNSIHEHTKVLSEKTRSFSSTSYDSIEASQVIHGPEVGSSILFHFDTRRKSITGVFAIVAGILALTSVNLRSSGLAVTSQFEANNIGFVADDILFEGIGVASEYELISKRKIGEGLYPYEHIAQVHKETVIALSADDTRNDVCSFDWIYTLKEDQGKLMQTGVSINVTFVRLGFHSIKLQADCKGGDIANAEFNVMVNYVRREIRTLSDADRMLFFDSLTIMYNTEMKHGRHKYGKDYRSIDYLVREHLYGAADKECDHWHDDAGIMTHHMGFTLELEQSLQSINPLLTVPYWDYSIDEHIYDDWGDSPIFSKDWYGSPSPTNEDHVIDTGRWAYLEVMDHAETFSEIHNPYGLLRSPWNTNPTPYIARYRSVLGVKDGGWSLPSCTNFNTAFGYNSTSEIFASLNGMLHGPIHVMIGGHWDFANKYAGRFNFTAALKAASGREHVAADFLLSSKALWRAGKLRCPEFCSKDTPSVDCSCSCPSDVFSGKEDSFRFLHALGLLSLDMWLNEPKFYTTANITITEIADLLCHVGHAGEMFTSAAPYDPLFWSLHGTSERFLSFKRLLAWLGKTELDETWGYRHVNNLPSDTGVVCNWTGTSGMQLPECRKDTCSGHRADDLLPMVLNDAAGQPKRMTNQEFYEFTSPLNSMLPYMYDSFIHWSGCKEQNISFYDGDDW